MDTNDLNRRIRYALSLDDADAQSLMNLAGYPQVTPEQMAAWRSKETDPGFQICPEESIIALLDGLILDRRGPRNSPDAALQVSEPVAEDDKPAHLDNNTVLKQLRIALSLRTDDVHAMISAGGGRLGKTEVSALFRKTSARNYRRCGDQVMRWFLAGVALQRDS